jgi:hypothetical protein
MVYYRSMEERHLASPSSFNLQLVTKMKTQIRINKNFTVRDPKTGRHYTFKKGEIAKGKQLQFATDRRIADNMFVVEEILPTEASIVRRRDGRYNWHISNGTDPQMDMEFIVLDSLAHYFDEETLRAKGSGQTQIFNRVSTAYLTEFAEDITYETFDGSDDPFANRVEEAWRGVSWANSSDIAFRCAAFINNFILNNY